MTEPTVLIAYEDTPQGRDAVALGRTFAELMSARPLLASVFTWPRGVDRREDLDDAIAAATRGYFDVPAEALVGLEPRTLAVVDQSVGMGLRELAAAEAARLVVVGSSHRGAVGRTLLGTTADSLLHGVECAVAVAPLGYGEGPAPKVERIGIAYDGSPESREALGTALALARRLDAELTLLGVADYPRYGYAATWSNLTEGGLHDWEREERNRALRSALATVPDEITATMQLLTGNPGEMLAEVSADYDLIVAGSRGYGPLRRTLLGSTTRRLIGASECPVLILPRGAAKDALGASEGRGA